MFSKIIAFIGIKPFRQASFIGLLILIVPAISVPSLAAAELEHRLEQTARKITAETASLQLSSVTLAVLPFQATEQLAKNRSDFAVSEMLTKYLFRHGNFKIVERAQIEEVLKEQKLAASGAVDAGTASGIGRIMGAKLLVVGSLTKLGDSYQVICKLVDSETATLALSDLFEVPAKTFEQDTRGYAPLAPEEEGISLYIAHISLPFIAGGNNSPFTYSGTHAGAYGNIPYSLTVTPLNPSAKTSYGYGFGVRYSPKRWLMLDAAYSPRLFDLSETLFSADAQNNRTSEDQNVLKLKGTAVEFSVNLAKILDKFRFYAGIGDRNYSLTSDMANSGNIVRRWDGTSGDLVEVRGAVMKHDDTGSRINVPFIRLGTEWRLQRRVGLAVFGSYNLTSPEYEYSMHMAGAGWNVPAGGDTPLPSGAEQVIYRFTLPRYNITAALSLNF
jgi:TolB-like protein